MAQVIDLGSQRIHEGNSVLIFPEGTRAAPQQPLPFRRGGAELAIKAGCQIVPVSHNAGVFWRNDMFIKKAGVVDVHIHPAIDTQGRDARSLMSEAEAVILKQLAQLDPPQGIDADKPIVA